MSWDLVADVRGMLAYPFMVHALQAGTLVAVAAGVLGWFMVLRRQTFAGHTLSVVAFPGAAAATLAGVAVEWGYYGVCVLAALVIAVGGSRDRRFNAEGAVIAAVQSFALACGYLFVALYRGFLGGVNALLFGSFLGISRDQVLGVAAVCGLVLVAVAVAARPLLFASVDPMVAAARGVPVRLVNAAFLVLLGLAAAAVSQVTGALLVFALLVMPAAAAQRLTARPVAGLLLTVGVGLVVTWVGLAIAFYSDAPVGFTTTSLGFGSYVLAALAAAAPRRIRGARVAVGRT